MDGRLHIKLQIAGRYYPLIIDRDEEERFRQAAKMINEKVEQYQQRYRDKDGQDFLAMAGLQFVLKLVDMEQEIQGEGVMDSIRDLKEELDSFLKDT